MRGFGINAAIILAILALFVAVGINAAKVKKIGDRVIIRDYTASRDCRKCKLVEVLVFSEGDVDHPDEKYSAFYEIKKGTVEITPIFK